VERLAAAGVTESLVVADEQGAFSALVEAVRRRARGEPFACMLLIDDEAVREMRALSPVLLSKGTTSEERRKLFQNAAAGSLVIEGKWQKEFLKRDPRPLQALGGVLRLADCLWCQSWQEARRVSEACQQAAATVRIVQLTDRRVPTIQSQLPGDRLVLWAPDQRTDQLGMWWIVLEFCRLPVSAICAPGGRFEPAGVEVAQLEQAHGALQSARVIVDASDDPMAARPLASLGVPLLCSRSSGADEVLDDVYLYDANSYDSMLGAVRRGLVGALPRLRPSAEPSVPPHVPADPRQAPLVSVVMPTRDRPAMLGRALESVRRQQHDAVEVIVVNDGGQDVSDIVSRFPQARLIGHEHPRGVSAARNRALDEARGEYVAFLDDDDIYFKDHLSSMVMALETHHADVMNAAHVAVFVDRDEDGSTWMHSLHVYDGVYDGLAVQIWQPVLVQSLCCRARVLTGLRFDESLPVAEDYEFIIRLGQRSEFGYQARPTWMITVGGGLSTSDQYEEALRRIFALHASDGSPGIEHERQKMLDAYAANGGRKVPWTPPLGRFKKRLRLEDLDGLPTS
jgi:glycosyltransferase involved in cell wall biosynthesis